MYALVYLGTCTPPRGTGRPFGGPVDPQFAPATAFPLEPGKRLVMGRTKDAGILVNSLIVARHHVAVTLELTGETAALRVENLGGGGGTFTRGLYFADETTLPPGGVFEIGGVLVFEFRQLA